MFGLTRKALNDVLAMSRPYSERSEKIERNGRVKVRLIQEPRGALRPIHETVGRALARIEPPDFLFCPVKRRSYADNAARHCLAKEVRTLDVKEYFPSTPSRRIYWFFNSVMHCSPDVSAVLAKLLTVNGHLATGSTVSPILSYYAFHGMWMAVNNIVCEAGCTLSVYMDDVTLSGEAVPDRVVWQVKQQLHACGLIYHKEKRYSRGVAEVTGVLITNNLPQVPNRQLKKAHEARQRLAAVAIDTFEAERLRAKLRGLDAQRRQVERARDAR